jgi:YjbE family integral membrane protein
LTYEAFLIELVALGQVIFIDVVLAGDNAIVVGMVAAGVAVENRARVIFWGIAAAVMLRIAFALVTTRLLAVIGLTFAGGLILMWVCWKLLREIRQQAEERKAEAARLADGGHQPAGPVNGAGKSVGKAVFELILADVSMSLDNVLAVAGVAREHLWVLAIGLLLSVALMGAAATVIARMLNRHHWIAYIGLMVIAWVAATMIWTGGLEIFAVTGPAG